MPYTIILIAGSTRFPTLAVQPNGFSHIGRGPRRFQALLWENWSIPSSAPRVPFQEINCLQDL